MTQLAHTPLLPMRSSYTTISLCEVTIYWHISVVYGALIVKVLLGPQIGYFTFSLDRMVLRSVLMCVLPETAISCCGVSP